jgi:hypothetical protein
VPGEDDRGLVWYREVVMGFTLLSPSISSFLLISSQHKMERGTQERY